MARSLWYFLFYSFLGFLAEVAFARAAGAPKRDRKCFYLLPLCPVYGLGALAVLALPPALTDGFWQSALWGGLAGAAMVLAAGLALWRYYQVAKKQFGGITGDLAGWFLQRAELWMLAALAAVQLMEGRI